MDPKMDPIPLHPSQAALLVWLYTVQTKQESDDNAED